MRRFFLFFFIFTSSQQAVSESDFCSSLASTQLISGYQRFLDQCREGKNWDGISFYGSKGHCRTTDDELGCLFELLKLKTKYINENLKRADAWRSAEIPETAKQFVGGVEKLCRAQQLSYEARSMWNAQTSGELYVSCMHRGTDMVIGLLEQALVQ